MITRQDIEDMGYEYYTPKTASPEGDYKVRSTKEKAKVLCKKHEWICPECKEECY